jgi:hypothetical protein
MKKEKGFSTAAAERDSAEISDRRLWELRAAWSVYENQIFCFRQLNSSSFCQQFLT